MQQIDNESRAFNSNSIVKPSYCYCCWSQDTHLGFGIWCMSGNQSYTTPHTTQTVPLKITHSFMKYSGCYLVTVGKWTTSSFHMMRSFFVHVLLILLWGKINNIATIWWLYYCQHFTDYVMTEYGAWLMAHNNMHSIYINILFCIAISTQLITTSCCQDPTKSVFYGTWPISPWQ